MLAIKRFGNIIKEYRNKIYSTQSDLANALKVDPTLINKIENGKKLPSLKFFPRLLKALKLSKDDIIKVVVEYIKLLRPSDKVKLLLEILPSDKFFVKKLLDNHNKVFDIYEEFDFPWNVGIFHFLYKLYFSIFRDKDLNNLINSPLDFFYFIGQIDNYSFTFKMEEISEAEIEDKISLKQKIRAGENYLNRKGNVDYKILDTEFSVKNRLADNLVTGKEKNINILVCPKEDSNLLIIRLFYDEKKLELIRKKIVFGKKDIKEYSNDELQKRFNDLLQILNEIKEIEKKEKYIKLIEDFIINLKDLSQKDL